MVILSSAICTKGGKALISRQFVEMTRIRIEGLLAAFPKLMSTDSKQQHTFVETESVRYVYQPMDNLYLLLVTNRASNIVEDLETLRLLSKVVPSVTGTTTNLTEDKIIEKCFELLFAFDEVITSGGYREPITLQQIRTNLDMESHEEKLHNMIKISKMEQAKDQARDAAKVIREKQREQQRLGQGSMQGIGSGGSGSETFTEPVSLNIPSSPLPPPPSSSSSRGQAVKGMSLMGAAKNKSLEDALVKEDKLAPIIIANKTSSGNSNVDHVTPSLPPAVQHPVMLLISEKVSAKISRDGMIELFEIKGSLTLTAATDASALCSVQLKPATNNNTGFRFNTHPNVNKALYEKSNLLQLKDASKGFPSARPVGILKWTYSNSSSDEMLPIKINCWPEEESRGQVNVSIEYSMDLKNIELHDVKIRIPLGTTDSPNILSVDGTTKHHASAGELVWTIDLIDQSNPTGSMEFSILQRNTDAFFPINVHFSSQQLYCNLEVVSVKTLESGSPIIYGLSKGMSSEEYIIG